MRPRFWISGDLWTRVLRAAAAAKLSAAEWIRQAILDKLTREGR